MISFDFRSENSRVTQSRSARPRTSVEQHTGLEAVPELHRRAGSLPEASHGNCHTGGDYGDHDESHLDEK